MTKFKLRILFSSLLFAVSAKCSFAQKSDSLVTKEVSMLSDSLKKINPVFLESFQEENYAEGLLGLEFPFYDVLISRKQEFSEFPDAGFYRFRSGNFDQIVNYDSNNLSLDTGKSISRLNILLGTKREQLLFLDHKQHIGKNFLAGISYNSIVSEGFLLHQFSKMKRFNANLSFSKGWYSVSGDYWNSKIEAEENGGIISGQETDGISKSDFELLQVNLKDAVSNRKNQRFELSQSFRLNKSDTANFQNTNNGFFIKVLNAYSIKGFSYKGTSDSSFYSNFYKDPVNTFDTSSVKELQNRLSIAYVFNIPNFGLTTELESALNRQDIIQKTDSIKGEFTYYTPEVNLLIASKSTIVGAHISYVSSGDIKEKDATYDFTGKLQFQGRIINYVFVRFKASSLSPVAMQNFYFSNHFSWQNNFGKETVSFPRVEVGLLNQHLIAFSEITNYKNYIYFNESALPVQNSGSAVLSRIGIKARKGFNKIFVSAEVLLQHSDNKIIRVPQTNVYGKISFKDRFFKNALLAEFGFSGVYVSSFKGDAYMPATGIYYLQNTDEVGDATSLHAFANLKIGSAVITLKLENLNHGIFGGENFLVPGYPVPPRTFKLGLKWIFHN